MFQSYVTVLLEGTVYGGQKSMVTGDSEAVTGWYQPFYNLRSSQIHKISMPMPKVQSVTVLSGKHTINYEQSPFSMGKLTKFRLGQFQFAPKTMETVKRHHV